MLNEQVIGLLQNNAGNPAMVRRIAEDNQLSQTEIAQALKIPEQSAARYMPDMNPEGGMEAGPIDGAPAQGKPAQAQPIAPVKPGIPAAPQVGSSQSAPSLAGAASAALGSGSAGAMGGSVGGRTGEEIMRGGPGPSLQPMPFEAPGQQTQAPATKPMPTSQMGKPMMEKPAPAPSIGSRPGGAPSLPRIPGRFRNPEGEQAFIDAFNRLRGNVQ